MPKNVVRASTDTIDDFQDLARELFSDVLDMSLDDCLVTDESCLCFFITDETPPDYAERFFAKYGFEVKRYHLIIDTLRDIARMRREMTGVN
jgi:hypothetical protein